MRRFILALQFLTVFRVKKNIEVDPNGLSSSMAFFPVVGALQGIMLVVASYIFSGLLPGGISAALILVILVLTNGALHLDGFADTIDGLAGGGNPEDRLRIMKDSATGAVGVVSLVLLLLVKYLAIAEMPHDALRPALFAAPVAGRWAMVPLSRWSCYARSEGGLGAAFCGAGGLTVIVATIIAAVLSALALGVFSLLILAALGAGAWAASVFFKKRLGGVTGDVFGFQSELSETVFLVMALGLSNLFAGMD